MRKHWTRALSLLLAIVLAVSLLPPLEAKAATYSGKCGKNVTWTLKNGVLTISGTGDMYNYDFYPGAPWHVDVEVLDSITQIVIEPGVTSIGDYAFTDCYYATSITIPEGLTRIGQDGLQSCGNLTEIDLPSSLRRIEYGGLANCRRLTEIEVPHGVTYIGDYAFSSCYGLKKINIPATVTYLGECAFSAWGGAFTVTFEGNPPTLGEDIFYWCTVTANYPTNGGTWTKDLRQDYGGTVTWVPYVAGLSGHATVKGKMVDPHVRIYPRDQDHLLQNHWILEAAVYSCAGWRYPVPQDGCLLALEDITNEGVVLSKYGYQDYVLPSAVVRTMMDADDNCYELNAYMVQSRNDGRPYISTAFGRQSGGSKTYADLCVNPMSVQKDTRLDIILSACGFGPGVSVTYYVGQNTSHRVSSTTGIFSQADLYSVLDEDGTVYAYAEGSDGSVTHPVELKLHVEAKNDLADLIEEMFAESSISMLEEDLLKLKISEDVPLLGGAEFDMSAMKLPLGVQFDGQDLRISLGLDLFQRESDKDGAEWKKFKDLILQQSDKLDASKDPAGDLKKAYDAYTKKNGKTNFWKDNPIEKNKFTVQVLGYAELTFANGEVVLRDGYLSGGVDYQFEHVLQGMVMGAPAYGGLEFKVRAGFGGKAIRYVADSTVPLELDVTFTAEPSLLGRAGAGVRGAVSGGVYALGSVPILIGFATQHVKIDLKGEVGLEGEFFIFEGKKPLTEGTTNLIDVYGNRGKKTMRLLAAVEAPETAEPQLVLTLLPRDYAEETSDWMGGTSVSPYSLRNPSQALAGVSFRTLQTGIMPGTEPVIEAVGDRLVMVWAQDDLTRDSYNRMRLVYSVYDPSLDSWSQPLAVWDDGHNEAYPELVSDGENLYVLWKKINMDITNAAEADLSAAMSNTELCLAKFDEATGTFTNAQMITANSQYEYQNALALSGGAPVVYWAIASDDTYTNSTLYRWQAGETAVVAENLTYVSSISAAGSEVTYLMDADGDLSDPSDITAYTVANSATSNPDTSKLSGTVSWAEYGKLEDETVLFLSDGSQIIYLQNGETKYAMEMSRMISSRPNVIQTPLGTMILWTENTELGNELYAISCRDGEWSEPLAISDQENLLKAVDTACCNGKVYGACTATEVIAEGETVTSGLTALTVFHINDFTDIALESYLDPEEADLTPGQALPLILTVQNQGTNPVSQITFTITDTLGTEVTQTVDVEIPSGGYETVIVEYPVPETFAPTTLTVAVQPQDDDADESDNSIALKVGKPDLTLSEVSVEHHPEGYLLRAAVKNGSIMAAENVVVTAYSDPEFENQFQTVTVGNLERDDYALTELFIRQDNLEFDENGTAKVYCSATSAGTDASTECCFLIIQGADTQCKHPIIEEIPAKEPTCTEIGYTRSEVCIACSGIMTEAEEIPITPHNYEDGVCADCGWHQNWVDAGTCGDNLTWSLTNGGLLTISGEGSIPDYSSENPAPWSGKNATRAMIDAGVSYIGDYAFYGCDSLKILTFPGDAPSISYTAFEGITATVLYPGDNTSWNYAIQKQFGGNITWKDKNTVVDVAEIDGTGFATLAEAFAAAEDGDTVKLLQDIVLSEKITADFDGKLDLDGMTLTVTSVGSSEGMTVNGDLTVIGTGEIKVAGPYGIAVTGNLTVEGGSFTASGDNEYLIGNSGTLVIEAGSFNGQHSCVRNFEGGSVTITGGDFTTTEAEGSDVTGETGIAISGGTFSKQVNPSHCAEGYVPNALDNGRFGVRQFSGSIQAKSATLLYEDMIQVRYKFQVTAADPADIVGYGMYIFSSREDAETYDSAKAVDKELVDFGGGVYYGYTDGIAAKEMGDSQFVVGYLKLANGDYVYGNIVEYSPKIYATRMVGKADTTAETKLLCNALMHYGAAAQLFFEYKTDALMNAGFDAVEYDASVMGESVFAVDTTPTNGFTTKAATLLFEGAITYRIKYAASSEIAGKTLYLEYTYKGETGSVEMELIDGAYYGYIDGIAAKDLDEALTAKPYYLDESGNKVYGAELVYSGYEYARRTIANSKNSEEMVNLAKALAMYIDAADIAIK